METQILSPSKIQNNLQNIKNVPKNEVSKEEFLHTIFQVTLIKWYSIDKIVVNDFSISVIALINNQANQTA